MKRKDKLCFVQFIHPGREHVPDKNNHKDWNIYSHKRKFLVNKGSYVSNASNKEVKVAEIGFWGEWEPQSQVIKVDNPVSNGPRYIYKPYYVTPRSYQGLQNTDPFVFGKQFLYTTCQQNTKKGPTQLRNLAEGSVILFGSYIEQKFALDTVFVVDYWIDHNKNNYKDNLTGKICEVYRKVTMLPLYSGEFDEKSCKPDGNAQSHRLYFGATFNKQVNGMFSFFPCKSYDCHSKGFARPVIEIEDVITGNLRQGKKLNPQCNLEHVNELWDNVVKQVVCRGLMLGISTELPKERTANKMK